MLKKQLFYYITYIFIFFCAGCTKQQPVPVNEEEVITTIKLNFHNATTNTHTTFVWKDADGDGASKPVIDTIKMSPNTVYTVDVEVLNETTSPATDITGEIKNEGVDHQFFFKKSATLQLTTAYKDTDANKNPIGLSNTFTTTTASVGELTIILKHELDKTITSVKGGDVSAATGSTDIEITFPVKVR